MATQYGFKVIHDKIEYLLDCDPMPMADGRFGAQVVITTGHDGAVISSRRYPSLEYFKTEAEAVEYAKEWGKAWIRENG